jgi:hypothetical protein
MKLFLRIIILFNYVLLYNSNNAENEKIESEIEEVGFINFFILKM